MAIAAVGVIAIARSPADSAEASTIDHAPFAADSVTVRHAIAHDISAPLASLIAGSVANLASPASASAALAVNQRRADVEQRSHGTKPSAALVVSFDGLGIGFDGPQGPGRSGNPSDNSLAVGPNHIVQTVNSRMAVFTKRGVRPFSNGGMPDCSFAPWKSCSS